MKKLFASTAALAIATLVSACGKDDGSGLDAVADLSGTWIQACTPDGDGGSQKGSGTYSGGTSTFVAQMYSDDSCATQAMTLTLVATYTGGAALSSPADAKELNVTPTKMIVNLKTDEMVSAFNGDQGGTATCGGGFAKDTDKELTATSCADSADFKSNFDPQYTIYKIDGSKLYFGACGDAGTANDCSAAAKRATSLETEYLTKG